MAWDWDKLQGQKRGGSSGGAGPPPGIDDILEKIRLILEHLPGDQAKNERYLWKRTTGGLTAGDIAKREKFQPVSQIIGGREFWGRWFNVTSDVLDPRPETETIIDLALQHGPAERVLDLGTGSGILAVTLAAEWPEVRAVAVDISQDALNIAAKNAESHNVTNRVNFGLSDWFDAVSGQFDLIVSNPPYIAASEMGTLSPDVRNWEPFMALTPGGDGLEAYRTIAFMLGQFLAEDGVALFEIGYAQGADVVGIFENAGFTNVSVLQDMGGKDRVVIVKK